MAENLSNLLNKHLWKQAPKMAPNYPHLVFLPLCGSPATLNSPDLCDNDIVDNDGVWLPRVGHPRHHNFPLPLSWITCSQRSQLPCLQQPYGELHAVRNWSLPPAAMWVSQLGSESSSPRQAIIWYHSAGHHLDYNLVRLPTEILWNSKSELLFEPQCFVIICYEAIDN